MRLIAGAMLALAGAAGGEALAKAGRLRARQLREMAGALAALEIRMLEKRLPLEEALRGCGSEVTEALAGDVRRAGPGAAFRESAARLSARGGALCCLTGEELAALESCFAALGASGVSRQRQVLAAARQALDGALSQAEARAARQGKLYGLLGLLAGLSAAIMLM